MSRCSYCRCELPGLETLCQQCFEAGCDRIAHPKQWWQRFQLRPQFTRDNFIGFSLLFTVSFASLRFDFPYFHARHMWNTETSALIATLIGCLAFFHHGGDKSEVGPTRAKKFDQRMNWKRFALLVVAEVAVGVFLYALFTFMPVGVQMLIVVASWAIVVNENLTFPKNKSIASLLCAITGVASFSFGVVWRITTEEVWSRLTLVGTCLLAALIFMDRRQEWLDQ